MTFLKWLKKKVFFLKTLIFLSSGLISYVIFRKNFERSYQGLIWLYCETRGKSRDLLSRTISFFYPYKPISSPSALFPGIEKSEIDRIVTEIQKNGFAVFKTPLSPEILRTIRNFALHNPAAVRSPDGSSEKIKAVFDPGNVLGVRYDFESGELIELPEIQNLVSDSLFVDVAGQYLSCRPYLDLVAMWWTAKFKDQPDTNAAQLYHFDMDRIKWLKVFIYLSDVGVENGPHYFVKRSHLSGEIPKEILRQGYARISDEEVVSLMGADRIQEITGAMGTFFFEDTSGLHKGEVVRGDARLALEFQYSNSLFGPPAIINVQEPSQKTARFDAVMKKYNWCRRI